MRDFWSYACVGSVCLGPFVMFVAGILIGSGKVKVPYRLIKVEEDGYAVED